MAILAPQPQVQREQQQDQRFFLGDMSDQQIHVIQEHCVEQHSENGALIATLLGIAAAVVGIFTAFLVGPLVGFLTFFTLGKTFSLTYHGIRNNDLLDASQALQAMNFREYIVLKRLDLSKDTIVQIHGQYKEHLANQIQGLRA